MMMLLGRGRTCRELGWFGTWVSETQRIINTVQTQNAKAVQHHTIRSRKQGGMKIAYVLYTGIKNQSALSQHACQKTH